uniref:Xin actin binding repeat containing 2b n=1 Tax=Neolamprologus brichardi TaxID=32507 RepID=A0A3Q4HM27_NEOBR
MHDLSKKETITSNKNVKESKSLDYINKNKLCTVCRRRAYPMDALIVDKKKYHKSCFCCEHCRNKLSLGNYVSLHGHLYCLPHYKQLLKSKGNYDDGLGQRPPSKWCSKRKELSHRYN